MYKCIAAWVENKYGVYFLNAEILGEYLVNFSCDNFKPHQSTKSVFPAQTNSVGGYNEWIYTLRGV